MMQIQYLYRHCEADQLEALLNLYGAEGWRLHTCEPVSTIGPSGSGILYAFVVMDKQVFSEEGAGTAPEAEVEGIRMKG